MAAQSCWKFTRQFGATGLETGQLGPHHLADPHLPQGHVGPGRQPPQCSDWIGLRRLNLIPLRVFWCFYLLIAEQVRPPPLRWSAG